jgi:elongation factor 1 alpha-like protein
MSRHRRAYDDEDLYDYDDYDDDYDSGYGAASAATSAASKNVKDKPKPGAGVNSTNKSKGTSSNSKPAEKAKAAGGAAVGKAAIKSTSVSASSTTRTSAVETTTQAVGQMGFDTAASEIKPAVVGANEPVMHGALSDDDEAVTTSSSVHAGDVEDSKPHVTVVVAGHVDAGKSTLVGHMLSLRGDVSQRIIRKYEKQSQEIGKGSFALAWVMDESTAEREHGVTIDIAER